MATSSPAIKPCRTAELNESTAGRDEGGFVVLAKVGDGLEVGLESVEDR